MVRPQQGRPGAAGGGAGGVMVRLRPAERHRRRRRSRHRHPARYNSGLMKLKFHGFWAAGFVALVATLSAQAPPAPATAPPQTPPAQNPAQRGPDFRARVDLITNDIVVRDSKGNFVPDLKPEDIQVFEDGVLQELVSMTVVTGGRVYNPMAPPTAAAPEGIILPKKRTVSDVSGRIFLFFVDDQHLQFGNTARVRQLFQKISKELVQDGDLRGIVSSRTA